MMRQREKEDAGGRRTAMDEAFAASHLRWRRAMEAARARVRAMGCRAAGECFLQAFQAPPEEGGRGA